MLPIPVTLLTGFLGAGKTTLLNHILQGDHRQRIAVIENEFAQENIDGQTLAAGAESLKTLSDGCICCSRAGELETTLLALLDEKDSIDRLIIESTGLADPGPVIRTFFSHPRLADAYCLDGIITLVDAVHAMQQLDQFPVAQSQIGYADRLLITKTDLCDDPSPLIARLRRINARATLTSVINGSIEIPPLLDIQGFMLREEPVSTSPLFRYQPAATDNVRSLTLTLDFPVELAVISSLMESLLTEYADQLLRYKGLLWITGQPQRLLFQGVQRLYSAGWDRPWQPDERPASSLIFIGIDLPEQKLRQAFAALRPAL